MGETRSWLQSRTIFTASDLVDGILCQELLLYENREARQCSAVPTKSRCRKHSETLFQ